MSCRTCWASGVIPWPRVQMGQAEHRGPEEFDGRLRLPVEVPMEDCRIKNGHRSLLPESIQIYSRYSPQRRQLVCGTPPPVLRVRGHHNPTRFASGSIFDVEESLVEIVQARLPKSGAVRVVRRFRSIPAGSDFEIGETITIKEGRCRPPGTINEITRGELTVWFAL
jgi:hypothetical protein